MNPQKRITSSVATYSGRNYNEYSMRVQVPPEANQSSEVHSNVLGSMYVKLGLPPSYAVLR
eukprot:scaffold256573_cov27-Prasinocladus_malaysianus.AAC.1